MNADQFINQGFLGYDFLTRAFTADYSVNDTKFKLFLIKVDQPAQAEHMLRQLLENNNLKMNIRQDDETVIEDKYNGKIPVILHGNYILGCINTDDLDLAVPYLKELAGNIK